ncbi:MAG TPA: DUF3108 domain-containing protein [Gemmatimonadales bacterium]|nr:DUF3108 domain-containing protein [Gemmatimonadales bacterium]
MIRPLVLLVGLLQGSPPPTPPSPAAAQYPFAVGETLTYSAKLGMLTLGSGTLQVAGIDSVRGVETFRLRFRLQGKTLFYSLDDVLESWVATDDFSSHRFVQDFVENDKPRRKTFEIFPDSGFYREKGRDTTFASPSEPLDDAAFFYFVRITPLEVGKKYVFDRYFRKEKNPVTIEVVKREKMELPDGSKVECLVLHPVIDTKGMFSKRSDTRIWLTDDERRLPVQIRSKFPFGTITLRLKDMVVPTGAASTSGG